MLMPNIAPGGIISPSSTSQTDESQAEDSTLAAKQNTEIKQPAVAQVIDQTTSSQPQQSAVPDSPTRSLPAFDPIIDKDTGETSTLSPVTWTASEYIAHPKSIIWFLGLGLGTLLFTTGVLLITGGDKISALAIIVLSVIFGIYAARQPREQTYALDFDGLHIGSRVYGFDTFKSFAIIDEGPFSNIVLMPLKRFMPMVSIYYDPKEEDKIVGFLSEHLAVEYREHDFVDRLMRKIKF